MSYIQLSQNKENIGFKPKINIAYENNEIFFKKYNNDFIIDDDIKSDILCPDLLNIYFNKNTSYNDLSNILKNGIFSMYSDNEIIESMYLNFLLEFNGNDYEKYINYIDDYMVLTINLPYKHLVKQLYLVSSSYKKLCFKVSINNDIINAEQVSLIFNYMLLDEYMKHEYRSRQFEYLFQQIITYKLYNFNSKKIKRILFMKGLCRGFYIYGNINNINNISLYFEDDIKINYNKLMIKLCCKKISNKLIYISLNNRGDIEYNFEAFDGGINFASLKYSKLIIDFELEENEIMFCPILANIMQYNNDQFNIKYNYGDLLCSINILEDPQWNLIYNKLIDNNKNTCPIMNETINLNDEYATCENCNNNFSGNAIHDWLAITQNKECPICRSEWKLKNYILYKNI